jgi:hypothetical protein
MVAYSNFPKYIEQDRKEKQRFEMRYAPQKNNEDTDFRARQLRQKLTTKG